MSERKPLMIASRFGSYSVTPLPSLAVALKRACAEGKTWLIIDAAVLAMHRAEIKYEISETRTIALIATEEAKSFEHLSPIFTRLLSTGFRRDSSLLAIGGGIIQDITAFIAAVLVRGVTWEFIPTTLLSQCDSCIGAKSSINIGNFKNQIGCFYPPMRIHMVEELLSSLPEIAIQSGLGEIVKFHLLEGQKSWDEIRRVLPKPSSEQLKSLIWTSLEIKKRYIEQDEFDKGVRNLLNYGHTFGHGFETASGFSIPHGIAVALGMSAATYVSASLHMVDNAHFREVDAVLEKIYHPFHTNLHPQMASVICKAMLSDKKNVHGKTFLILTKGPGKMEKVAVNMEDHIVPLLSDFLSMIC